VKRLVLVLECACVLLLCAAGASLSHLWKSGPLSLQLAGVALIVPTISAILFLCLSLGVPDLYSVDSIRFPLNLTLPLIYVATLWLTMDLMSRVGLSITRLPDAMSAIKVWNDPWVLGSTLVAGVICLSILGVLERDRPSEGEGQTQK